MDWGFIILKTSQIKWKCHVRSGNVIIEGQGIRKSKEKNDNDKDDKDDKVKRENVKINSELDCKVSRAFVKILELTDNLCKCQFKKDKCCF